MTRSFSRSSKRSAFSRSACWPSISASRPRSQATSRPLMPDRRLGRTPGSGSHNTRNSPDHSTWRASTPAVISLSPRARVAVRPSMAVTTANRRSPLSLTRLMRRGRSMVSMLAQDPRWRRHLRPRAWASAHGLSPAKGGGFRFHRPNRRVTAVSSPPLTPGWRNRFSRVIFSLAAEGAPFPPPGSPPGFPGGFIGAAGAPGATDAIGVSLGSFGGVLTAPLAINRSMTAATRSSSAGAGSGFFAGPAAASRRAAMTGAEPVSFSVLVTGAAGPGDKMGDRTATVSMELRTTVPAMVAAGDKVVRGQTVMILEAMKMEHAISAPADGTVADVYFAAGDQVDEGAELLRLAEDDA
ncbi:MAG: hypothetical protein IIA35_07845 [Proteobacteria bacterium]|nr:hypothetical protein [Pseudomonadota bacterium]